MTSKHFLVAGSFVLALAVGIGAFGAHALKPLLDEVGKADVFKTAVNYHFYHGFALLVVGILMQTQKTTYLSWAGYTFCLGIVLFCGALYGISLTGFTKLGIIAPFGGLSFICGWILCGYHVYQTKK